MSLRNASSNVFYSPPSRLRVHPTAVNDSRDDHLYTRPVVIDVHAVSHLGPDQLPILNVLA